MENIRSIQRDNLVDYISDNYKADRMVVAAAGPVEHEDIVKCVSEGCICKKNMCCKIFS